MSSLPASLLDRVIDRLDDAIGDPVAVLITGSFAGGTASSTSDLDVTALYEYPMSDIYRTWFEDGPAGPLHVSVDCRTQESWLENIQTPASWSFGFPTAEPVEVIRGAPEVHQALGEPPRLRRPAGEPQLEDCFEAALKVRRAAARSDPVGARWHAQTMAGLVPGLLLSLNEERRVRDRRDALQAALDLQVVPARYRSNLTACLGLRAAEAEEVVGAADELIRSLLEFLRERRPDVDPQPWISRYLVDGTLERFLSR